MTKKRLDVMLTEQGFYGTRQKAKAAIMAGCVLVNDQLIDKAGTQVEEDAIIRTQGNPIPFVSRGGLKLEKARVAFQLNFSDKIVVDIGASTGGFTHVALLNGAAKVYAVDVGYGQLAWEIRNDDRVVVMERTNARYLTREDIPEKPDMVVTDVSFISLTKIFPAVNQLLGEGGALVALIKPQFEAGRDLVGKNGVVRDFKVQKSVILKIIEAAMGFSFSLQGLDYSPITGPKGNIEYLAYFRKVDQVSEAKKPKQTIDNWVEDVISRAKKLRRE